MALVSTLYFVFFAPLSTDYKKTKGLLVVYQWHAWSRMSIALIHWTYIYINFTMIGVCFTYKCYIVTFHTRHSFQTHVSIQQAILLHMYSIITTMKCCIALCLIINNLSSLLKGFQTFPKERILPEGIICDSTCLKYSSGSSKGIPRFPQEIFCSPTGIHTCVLKDNTCSPKGIHSFPKEIFCCPKAIHICVSKDNSCGYTRLLPEVTQWVIALGYIENNYPRSTFELAVFGGKFKVPLRRNFSNSLFLHFLNL